MRPEMFLMPNVIGIDFIYSITIIICSLMIYFGTKELYELSSYGGIKYFRYAFMFFAIAYFFRFLIRSILFVLNIQRILDFSPRFFGHITMIIFIYFSSMAIFYLLYSVIWKKWESKPNRIYLFHSLAIIMAIISTFLGGGIILGLNLFLFLFIIFIIYIISKSSKKQKKQNLYGVYILLFFFWILNIIDILIPDFLQFVQIIIYSISIILFLLMLYKVLKGTSKS